MDNYAFAGPTKFLKSREMFRKRCCEVRIFRCAFVHSEIPLSMPRLFILYARMRRVTPRSRAAFDLFQRFKNHVSLELFHRFDQVLIGDA